MGQQRSFVSRLKRPLERIRKDGLLPTLLHYLKMVGIDISLFYYMKEVLPPDLPDHLTGLPEGFEFSVFGLDEVTAISKLPERKGYVSQQYVIDNFNKGEICLGIKCIGEIAAFSWFSLERSWTKLYPATMKENEAYLYDMYVLKAFRGKNLAPILRYKNYEVLTGMGRDTFYSVTEFFNPASLRFKLKLNAQIVFLGLYAGLFNKYQGRWVLKRY